MSDVGLRLVLLHAPRLVLDGSEHALPPKDAALLAILALDGPTPRARVAALLWPDATAEQARNNLRQRVFRLRRLAGRDVVLHGPTLALASPGSHDLADLEAALRADAAGAAGELLGTHAYGDSTELAAWVDGARQQWRAARRDLLAELAARHEREDRIATALQYAERLARDEPLLEHAQRQLMRLHYRRGDRGAALQVYERLKAALDEALGETPSRETQQIVALIEAAITLPVAPPPQPVAVLRPPRLVGREREWAAMAAARANARPVLVMGEPGIGKSRLLADFATAAEIKLTITSRPGDARVPFTLLSRLVHALWAARPTSGGWEAWATEELARIAPELGPAPAGRVDVLRLRRAVEHAIATNGVDAILIDDLQFGDDASLDMLPALATGSGACWWLFGVRRAEIPEPMRAWLDASDTGSVEPVVLGPLDAMGVGELLESLALPGFDAPDWPARLHRHTGGHPLFLLETVMALGSSTRLEHGAAGDLPLPRNVAAMIERRLAALTPPALKLSRVAALAGVDFSVDLAARVLDTHPMDLAEPWAELEAALVMQGWSFAHDLVQEAARNGVPAPVRCWLHERIAQVLSAAEAAVAPARLAHHWREARQHLRAGECFHRAAVQVRSAGRVADECRLLRTAVEEFGLAGQQEREFDALTELVIATREARSTSQALMVAEELAAGAENDRQRAIAGKELGVCHMHAMRHDLAVPALENAVRLARAANDTDNANHAGYLLAMAGTSTLGAAQAADRLTELLPWAEAHADNSLRHCFLVDLAILLDHADRRTRAVPLFERGIRFFEQAREPANLAAANTMLSRCLQVLGRAQAACHHAELALGARETLSDGVGGQGIEALNYGRSLCEIGRYSTALDLLEPAHERMVAQGVTVTAAAMRQAMARVLMYLGQPAKASALLRDLPDEAPPHQRALFFWTQAHLQPAGLHRQRLLEHALAEFQSSDLPFVRVPVELDRVAGLDGEPALQRCRSLLDECTDRELFAARMLGRLRLLGRLLARGEPKQAHESAERLMDELPHYHPVLIYLPELHASCRRAAIEIGDSALAERCLDAAVAWIHQQALPNVPEPFRDSFLNRNPVNRDLLALAANRARR